ncbi:hypothetical protein MKW94_029804 [Papaver nudicaule]|uniref:Uncharacterized protein n=1 Tax=Papaver nudicaule TaxID=74823 RepID=A0AA41VTE6_PAPNU|nr:hypothetical protein [Papaver nudicaule]
MLKLSLSLSLTQEQELLVKIFVVVLLLSSLFLLGTVGVVESQCTTNPVIFNFGDSNSDTGGLSAGTGSIFGPPNGRTFFHSSTGGRLSDGRLVIDLLCKKVSWTNEGLKNAVYTFDIGQNDLSGAFSSNLPYDQVIQRIPSFIAEIKSALWSVFQNGGRNFWIHNTGPLGCLPQRLSLASHSPGDLDQHGCLQHLLMLRKPLMNNCMLMHKLRSAMENVTIVYTDIFAIKYDLIANSAVYGFENPLTACCGFGGPPYNVNNTVGCGQTGYNVCAQGTHAIHQLGWNSLH